MILTVFEYCISALIRAFISTSPLSMMSPSCRNPIRNRVDSEHGPLWTVSIRSRSYYFVYIFELEILVDSSRCKEFLVVHLQFLPNAQTTPFQRSTRQLGQATLYISGSHCPRADAAGPLVDIFWRLRRTNAYSEFRYRPPVLPHEAP